MAESEVWRSTAENNGARELELEGHSRARGPGAEQALIKRETNTAEQTELGTTMVEQMEQKTTRVKLNVTTVVQSL